MEQIEKNTVKAENQLRRNQYITYINPDGKGKRFLAVGNSITRHGVKHDIGWHNDWGMAASNIERDYVHILYRALSERYTDAVLCITQVATWEREFKNGTAILPTFKEARDFGADALVMRLVENCPNNAEDIPLFKEKYGEYRFQPYSLAYFTHSCYLCLCLYLLKYEENIVFPFVGTFLHHYQRTEKIRSARSRL